MSDDPEQKTADAAEVQPADAAAVDGASNDVRAQVRAVLAREGLTMAAAATDAAIPYGTFSAWVGGTYNGRNDRIEERAARWLHARQAARRTRALAPPAPGFQRTPFADAAFGLFEHAQYVPDFVILSGGAGVGKTTAAEAYRAQTPNVWVMTAEPCLASPRALLDELRDALAIEERSTSQTISRAIAQRLRGTAGLLIVDEAQHLSTQALDQLRTLHDKAAIGVALAGNETVYSRLQGAARQAAYAQLFSRVGMRVQRTHPAPGDIDTLLDAWRIEGARERKLLHAIGRKPGALRGLTKTVRVAHMLALGAGEPLDAKHLSLAWQRLGAGDAAEVV